ncbi:universal stress protein [Christiangramia sediminis]|uniref:Universal stress protein n=1 Tax=Christiangramia sediminis TaxID=2881336 RepID=A0A9X1LLD0_9FLAO|nr:universal stress protein [Christiangramia sediminis]MCB7482476.1 universal stress protein [Christiangramia sediminis]
MKNILIATDFSKEAYCALHYVTQLFTKADTKFFIANFYGEKINASIYHLLNEEEFSKMPKLKQESQLACQETLHQIIRDSGLASDRFEVISSEQKLSNGIKDLIQSHNLDLVVMGTKKHTGSLAGFMGTNTTRIIEKTLAAPLLIIPRELDFTPPANIAFASELIFDFNFEAMAILKEIATEFKSTITVIHYGEETEMSQRQWKNYNAFKKFFEGININLEFSSTHVDLSRNIADFVKNNHIDMLSMGYYKHSATGKFFREPIVEKIDRHLSFPFLILPEKK